MNTNKIVHTNNPNPSNNYQEMIKTSTYHSIPSLTPHNHQYHESSVASLHASSTTGMLPSLSHHYDTSSVPSHVASTNNYSPSPPTATSPPLLHHHQHHQHQPHHHHHQHQYNPDSSYSSGSIQHKREYTNNRYHPYHQRSPISPPPPANTVNYTQRHVGGMELHNCSIDSASSTGTVTSIHAINSVVGHSQQQHHVNNRSSPTKKSPISSEHDMLSNQTDVNMQLPSGVSVSNNRKKIPNRSSYETHVFMNAPTTITTNSNPVQPPQKRKNVISKQEMIKVLHLPQTQASSILGCSLSTLKRRFYELKEELEMEKWPQFYHEIRHLAIFSKVYPMSFYFILNHEGCDDVHKPLTKRHLQKSDDFYEQCFNENTNHFLQYCKTLR